MTKALAKIVSGLLLASALVPPAFAAADDAPDHAAGRGHDDNHDDGEDIIVVAGHPPIDFGLLASTATLQGDALVADMRGQIGETLAKLPGVSASSFAPGVSRPVLRGLDGDRIRVLVDGIGSVDASTVSADHAVVFDPLTVDHIDVVHGPGTLIFGGQAIGGAVNALDKRIPRSVPETISATAIGGYGTAGREWSAGGAIDVPLTGSLVAHADASWRRSRDLRIGGYAASPALRADILAHADAHRAIGEIEEADELEEAANVSGRLENSAARSRTLGAGLAFINSGGNLGISVQRYDTLYGVPERPGSHGHGEGGEEHPVRIDLGQTRYDLRGAVNIGGLFESLQVRGAYGEYKHVELEGDEIGTSFAGKGEEFRADLIQAKHGGWRGRSGVQVQGRRMTVRGDEAVTPDNAITRFGVFTLQSFDVGGGLTIEGAGRYERATVKSNPVAYNRGFDLWSGAAGVSFAPADGWKIGANYVRGARAPAPEELLSDGLHIATQAYEIGDPSFTTEKSDGYEAYLRYQGDRAQFALTGYQTDFANFIAAVPTGDEFEGFPVYRYTQLPARFRGFEASGSFDAVRWDSGKLTLDATADYTRATLKSAGPVPRIPPLRLRGGAEVQQGGLRVRGEVEWNKRQNRVAALENPVPGFTLVNLSADWHPMGEDGPLTLILSADNLFDVVGRRAASFTRDFVPLPGRDVRLTAKFSL